MTAGRAAFTAVFVTVTAVFAFFPLKREPIRYAKDLRDAPNSGGALGQLAGDKNPDDIGFPAPAPPERKTAKRSAPAEILPEQLICDDLFNRLTEAAGLAGRISAEWATTGKPSSYYPRLHQLYFGVPICRNIPPAAFIMAHELGHALQHTDGTWRAAIASKDALAAEGRYNEAFALHRNVEAQADTLAVELMLKAGFSRVDVLKGAEEFMTCENIRAVISDEYEFQPSHPPKHVRYTNVLLHGAILQTAGRFRRDTAAGQLRALHRPTASLDNFDNLGRLKIDFSISGGRGTPVPLAPEADRAIAFSCGRLRGDESLEKLLSMTAPGPRAVLRDENTPRQ